MSEDNLIERFIASFNKLDEMADFTALKVPTDSSQLEPLLAKLPARFPPLFQDLILSYRWAEVDLGSFRLLPNPPGPDLSGLLTEMTRDPAFWESLPSAGYIQFGRGPDIDYDPVCFDIRSRTK